MVPPGALSARLCTYSQRYGTKDAPPLVNSRTITSASTISWLGRGLNALPRPSTCFEPNRYDSMLAILQYAHKREVRVRMNLTRCLIVTNGHRIATFLDNRSGSNAANFEWHLEYMAPVPVRRVLVLPSQKCPARPPEHIRSRGDFGTQMAPAGADHLLICRYWLSSYERIPRSWLMTERRYTDRQTIDRLASLLQNYPREDPFKGYSCPGDSHLDSALAVFGYPDSRVVDTYIYLTGCTTITNGRWTEIDLFENQRRALELVRDLNRLAPVPGRPHADERFFKEP